MEQERISLENFEMSEPIGIRKTRYHHQDTIPDDSLTLRINGTLSEFSSLGSEEKSQRAVEVKRQGMHTNTSCSIYTRAKPDQQIFHLLVDVGEGIINNIKRGVNELGIDAIAAFPDALLITHSHNDHVKELPVLVDKFIDNIPTRVLKIFCTSEV